MNGQNKPENAEQEISKVETSKAGETGTERRRRLLKAGLGATPILMSLSSRSVFACKTSTPSGFSSLKVATSSPGSKKCSVSGKTPRTWCDLAEYKNTWPSRIYPNKNWCHTSPPTKCGDLFGSHRHADKTCHDVMRGEWGADEFDRWCVAARLNARAGLTSGICEESDVNAMWHECNTRGYYEPTAGQKWTKADCVTYLKSTCTG
jgi:hypothetical protein